MPDKYFAVPKTAEGHLDLDYSTMREGISVSGYLAYCRLDQAAEVRESWTEITENEFNQVKSSVTLPPVPTEPTNAEIKENQLAIMSALADIYTIFAGGA